MYETDYRRQLCGSLAVRDSLHIFRSYWVVWATLADGMPQASFSCVQLLCLFSTQFVSLDEVILILHN